MLEILTTRKKKQTAYVFSNLNLVHYNPIFKEIYFLKNLN